MSKVPDVHVFDEKHIDAGLNRWIEGDSETERIAARMLKAMKPLLEEVVTSGDMLKLSGAVRGFSSIAASLILSMPPHMREGIRTALRKDLEAAFAIEHPVEERRE